MSALAAPAAHLAWIGLLAFGVVTWCAPRPAPPAPGTVTGAETAVREPDRLLADLRRLVDGGDGAVGPAAARVREGAARDPEALAPAVDRFGAELLANPRGWVRAFDRLHALDGPTRVALLRALDQLCDRLALDHEDDAEFLARLDQFRRHHVGEDF